MIMIYLKILEIKHFNENEHIRKLHALATTDAVSACCNLSHSTDEDLYFLKKIHWAALEKDSVDCYGGLKKTNRR